jgi:ParB-like chromosome segregation protein Spo0J
MNAAYPNLLPKLSEEEFQSLKTDIEKRGVQIPIEIDEDTNEILDGYHRYKACNELGIEPPFVKRQFKSEPERVWHAVALNIHRRQLAKFQVAALVVKYSLPAEEAKAKERKIGALRKGPKPPASAKLHSREKDEGKAAEKVGKEAGVSARYVAQAKVIQKEAPEVFNEVLDGKKTLAQAKRELPPKKNEKTKAPILPRDLQTKVDQAVKYVSGEVQKYLPSFPGKWKNDFIKKLMDALTTLGKRIEND